jgi:hypothetical protein
VYRNKGNSDDDREPPRHPPERVVLVALLLLVLLAILFFASGSKASVAGSGTTTVTVVNSEGIPAGCGHAVAQANGMTRITNGGGRALLTFVGGGNVLRASRTYGMNDVDRGRPRLRVVMGSAPRSRTADRRLRIDRAATVTSVWSAEPMHRPCHQRTVLRGDCEIDRWTSGTC